MNDDMKHTWLRRIFGRAPHPDCEGKADAWKLLPPGHPRRLELESRRVREK